MCISFCTCPITTGYLFCMSSRCASSILQWGVWLNCVSLTHWFFMTWCNGDLQTHFGTIKSQITEILLFKILNICLYRNYQTWYYSISAKILCVFIFHSDPSSHRGQSYRKPSYTLLRDTLGNCLNRRCKPSYNIKSTKTPSWSTFHFYAIALL